MSRIYITSITLTKNCIVKILSALYTINTNAWKIWIDTNLAVNLKREATNVPENLHRETRFVGRCNDESLRARNSDEILCMFIAIFSVCGFICRLLIINILFRILKRIEMSCANVYATSFGIPQPTSRNLLSTTNNRSREFSLAGQHTMPMRNSSSSLKHRSPIFSRFQW